ncbi:MAG: hypothetical protein CML81_00210 [Rhodobiaceae bacterium]|nr:hypothetical protein [Rhodobiaceae bacterium]|tara:strand:+ start:1283 stop:1732 length:450 start_codon:yes stop_codon:yes gene_type:complete
MVTLKKYEMTKAYQIIDEENFLTFCKDTIPSLKDFKLKINVFNESGVEIEYFPKEHHIGKSDKAWTHALFAIADLVSYACVLTRHPTAIPSVTTNMNANFFNTTHVCNVRANAKIQEHNEDFAHLTVDLVTFQGTPIAKITCNYLVVLP